MHQNTFQYCWNYHILTFFHWWYSLWTFQTYRGPSVEFLWFLEQFCAVSGPSCYCLHSSSCVCCSMVSDVALCMLMCDFTYPFICMYMAMHIHVSVYYICMYRYIGYFMHMHLCLWFLFSLYNHKWHTTDLVVILYNWTSTIKEDF